ncbi:DNA-processing protein DprA [Anaerovibrio sp.]|uniref:DNA-processing protein DprA n=1 Tax=Anaerovibrio sp. TaxID=1872532 RepID=UPI003F1687AE
MENFFLAALQGIDGLGGTRIRRLTDYFGSAAEVWKAAEGEIAVAGILSGGMLEKLLHARREKPDWPERLQEECGRKGIRLCSEADAAYPVLLREIRNPPAVLFYRGTLMGDRPRLAMVGSRRVSAYGRNVAESLGRALAGHGFAVVSGAALGVDTCSHRGALAEGVTEAVLGCGVDVAYPPVNGGLLAEIAEKGAVISEYLPGTRPLAANFPARNRIISGMSLGTIVVEAAKRSGSLITAEMAVSEGRDVFAVPGSIFSPVSMGCNRLIQQGAKLVIDSCDIIEEYPEFAKKCSKQKNNDEKNKTHAIITETEEEILRVLSFDEPLSIDEVIYRLHGGDVANAAFVLLQLEFKGLVRSDDLHRYVRTVKEGVL